MNKLEIINYLKTNNKSGSKTRENHVSKKFPDDYKLIIEIDFVNDWYEKLYCYLYKISEVPKCKCQTCNKKVNFNKFGKGYYGYCSQICKNKDTNFIEKIKENNLIKFGETNPMKCDEVKKKGRITRKERYGSEVYNNIEKCRNTKKERYGDEFYNNREKSKETSLERHNCENYTNREKAKQTSLELYGNEFYNNCEKQWKTNMSRYGVKVYNNKEKAEQTSLLKYCETSYCKTKEHKNKMYLKSIVKTGDKLNLDASMLSFNGIDYTVSGYCKTHNHFTIDKYVLKNRILYGIENICTICNPVSKNASIKEIELREFIESLNIVFIENDRKILNGKEIDIYLPDYKLGIEFNGLYWHSSLKISNDAHLNKTENCETRGIQLLHLFENEWKNKKNIIKSIIRSKLNIIDTKLFARKCEIREIDDNQLVRNFLETNHLQGFVGSNVKIGLFYDNELVSLMTFGKKRISMGNKTVIDGEYEMLRFCNKLNTQVVGGASRLLKYFINNYKPKSILTFADRRYSNGNLYKQLGFEHIGNTKPNYWYFRSHEYILHYRFKFRKDVLIKEGYDSTKTELEIMSERGYSRIYDCGNMKFLLKLV